MRFFHLSDLHLGKRVNEFSMIEDQQYILARILSLAEEEKPDAVFIAGDVYDKSVPSAEAVQLFDDFLVQLSARTGHVFVISGNHDSPERIAFGGRLMDASGIHMSPVYTGEVSPVSLQDEWGEVRVYMLPFVKPATVRRFFADEEIVSYTDAVRAAIGAMDVDPSKRNVLLTHQFVTGAERSESEELSVGGSDNVDASVFSAFDYVALGHIHKPQNAGERIRYCGTPLKYSFSEAGQQKSVTCVELGKKGDLNVRTLPLVPLRDLREVRGSYMQVTARENYAGTNTQDYLHVTLTDENDVPDALGKLRAVYPNLMKLDYDNARTRGAAQLTADTSVERKTPLTLFSELYEKQNGAPLSAEQTEVLVRLIGQIWEESE